MRAHGERRRLTTFLHGGGDRGGSIGGGIGGDTLSARYTMIGIDGTQRD